MTMLSDRDIAERCIGIPKPMIDPFIIDQVREVRFASEVSPGLFHPRKVISFGCSSYGYDARIGFDFRIFTNLSSKIIDPKAIDERVFTQVTIEKHDPAPIIIPPNSFALGVSLERFDIPRDVVCIVLGKSTYARCGIIVNVTPLEPCWRGYITIEISNTAPLPAMIYPGEGICQVIFLHNDRSGPMDRVCQTSYGDRQGGGKYQDQQQRVVTSRV
jgi:dCTP deaminase